MTEKTEKIRITNLSKAGENCHKKYTLVNLDEIRTEPDENEKNAFYSIIFKDLSPEKKELITIPAKIYLSEKDVLAIHWHPEYIPLDIISRRIKNCFPNAQNSLIIPTQHNLIMELNGYVGVEVDCYSREFSRKIQLLLHFGRFNKLKATKLVSMIEHTFKYRSKQLFEFLETLSDGLKNEKISKSLLVTGVNEEIVEFVKITASKLLKMVNDNFPKIPPIFLKNKIVRDYFDELRKYYNNHLIDMAQVFIKAVKEIVKSGFDNSYFYGTNEMIEEARSAGACIVIPHPEQFWPVLLAEYDVDGYEVWNPQSREYTEFLIQVLFKQNKTRRFKKRPLLVFMGDDTHMGEKAREIEIQDIEKAGREIGVQIAWNDPDIQKILIEAGLNKELIIEEYKSRLGQPAEEGETYD